MTLKEKVALLEKARANARDVAKIYEDANDEESAKHYRGEAEGFYTAILLLTSDRFAEKIAEIYSK